MWCLLFVAIASSAPPTDCSIPSFDVCQMRAAIVNAGQWKDDAEQIGYLAMCVGAGEKAKYLRARLIERALANR